MKSIILEAKATANATANATVILIIVLCLQRIHGISSFQATPFTFPRTTTTLLSSSIDHDNASTRSSISSSSSSRRSRMSNSSSNININSSTVGKRIKGNNNNNNNNSNTKKRKQKQKQNQNANQMTNRKRRHSKQELNDLVRNIGLTPVTPSSSSSLKNTSNNHNLNPQQQQQQQQQDTNDIKSQLQILQSTKGSSIPTTIQLQYARNGHAVLRSTIPKSILRQVKAELVQYSKEQELNAWKQKVEVMTNSIKIANSCTSIEGCQSILSQQHQQQQDGDDTITDNTKIQIPFLQHFNTWRHCPTVSKLVTSPYLSHMASQLLDVPSSPSSPSSPSNSKGTIRLYQDSLFHKRCGDGPTPWHSDARMAPFDTSHMITFWIPLDDIPHVEDGGTGLWFVDKSHVDFALPFWNPVPDCDSDSDGNSADVDDIYGRLEERYGGEDSIKHYMPIDVGDCTVHAGWTLHSANGGPMMDANDADTDSDTDTDDIIRNKGDRDRYALAVTYVDAAAEIRRDVKGVKHGNSDNTQNSSSKSKGHDEDRQSYRDWIGDVEPRQYFEHPLVPIVWPPSKR